MSEQQEQQFALQRIYVKDVSFESPQGVEAFTQQWQPQIHQELSTTTQRLEENLYEVVLTVTVTGKHDDKTVFLVEVKQAGIFALAGFDDAQLRQVMGIHCPNILFPYARTTIDSLMVAGTLPPLLLPAVNFDALFQQAMSQQQPAAAH